MAFDDEDLHNGPHKVPGQYVYKGMVCGGYINKKFLENPDDFDVQDDDIFVITYPKSGTMWTLEILSLILSGGDVKNSTKTHVVLRSAFIEFYVNLGFIGSIINWLLSQTIGRLAALLPETWSKRIPIAPPEFQPILDGKKYASSLLPPRTLKSHLPVQFIPSEAFNKGKIIYIARNPKDTAVSYYHFYRSTMAHGFYKGTWKEFLHMFINKQLSYGDWFDHVTGFWKYKDHPNVLFMKYEDMKQDPHAAVRKMAEHVGKEISDDVVDVIVDWTSFKQMRKRDDYDHAAVNNKKISLFLRKGVVGDWENHFTVAQNAEFDKLYNEKMKDTGLTVDFGNGL